MIKTDNKTPSMLPNVLLSNNTSLIKLNTNISKFINIQIRLINILYIIILINKPKDNISRYLYQVRN